MVRFVERMVFRPDGTVASVYHRTDCETSQWRGVERGSGPWREACPPFSEGEHEHARRNSLRE